MSRNVILIIAAIAVVTAGAYFYGKREGKAAA